MWLERPAPQTWKGSVRERVGLVFQALAHSPSISSPPFSPHTLARFKTLFLEAAKESESSLIPYLIKGVANVETLNQPDGIHPTAGGPTKVAENVWTILQPVATR